MAGYRETQVRRAMRSSIPALRQVEDELTAGIRGLRRRLRPDGVRLDDEGTVPDVLR